MKNIKSRFNKEDFRTFFLGVAFPLHIWVILMVMRDYEWIVERSNNMLDGIGVAAYSLVFTFLECLIIAAVLLLIGSTFPRTWSTNVRNTILLSAFYITLLWGLWGQAVFILEFNPLPPPLLRVFVQTGRPVFTLALVGLGLVGGSALASVWAGWRSQKFQRGIHEFVSRATPLVILYLIFDAFALIFVMIRNLIGTGS